MRWALLFLFIILVLTATFYPYFYTERVFPALWHVMIFFSFIAAIALLSFFLFVRIFHFQTSLSTILSLIIILGILSLLSIFVIKRDILENIHFPSFSWDFLFEPIYILTYFTNPFVSPFIILLLFVSAGIIAGSLRCLKRGRFSFSDFFLPILIFICLFIIYIYFIHPLIVNPCFLDP